MFPGLNICSFKKKAPTDLIVLHVNFNLELEKRKENVHAFLQDCYTCKEYRGWNVCFFYEYYKMKSEAKILKRL